MNATTGAFSTLQYLHTVRIVTAYTVAWFLHVFSVLWLFSNSFMHPCCCYFPLIFVLLYYFYCHWLHLLFQFAHAICLHLISIFIFLYIWYYCLHSSYQLNVSVSLHCLHKQPAFQVRGSGVKESLRSVQTPLPAIGSQSHWKGESGGARNGKRIRQEPMGDGTRENTERRNYKLRKYEIPNISGSLLNSDLDFSCSHKQQNKKHGSHHSPFSGTIPSSICCKI